MARLRHVATSWGPPMATMACNIYRMFEKLCFTPHHVVLSIRTAVQTSQCFPITPITQQPLSLHISRIVWGRRSKQHDKHTFCEYSWVIWVWSCSWIQLEVVKSIWIRGVATERGRIKNYWANPQRAPPQQHPEHTKVMEWASYIYLWPWFCRRKKPLSKEACLDTQGVEAYGMSLSADYRILPWNQYYSWSIQGSALTRDRKSECKIHTSAKEDTKRDRAPATFGSWTEKSGMLNGCYLI